MADGVAEVQGLAQSLLIGVFPDDVFFHQYGVLQHLLQATQMPFCQIVVQQLCPHALVADETMLEHLRIACPDVLRVKGLKENGVEDDEFCIVEDTYFILQSSEVDARLSSHAGIYHGKKCRGYVDEVNAALEGGGGEASQVCHHASSQVDQAGMAGSAASL